MAGVVAARVAGGVALVTIPSCAIELQRYLGTSRIESLRRLASRRKDRA